MPEPSPCTPEGGLEALADALFTLHRFDIPCEGAEKHTPLTKDKAGRKDSSGRMYRYWTCTRCQPRTKRNCRSYINAAVSALGRQVVSDIASALLQKRRTGGQPYELLDCWLRGKLNSSSTSVQREKKRQAHLIEYGTPRKRFCPDLGSDADPGSGTDVLQSAYAARKAIDHLIHNLTRTGPPPVAKPITPTQPAHQPSDSIFLDDSDGEEVIFLPTPPSSRVPLRALTTNPSNPHTSSDVVSSLIRRFRQATDAYSRNAARKEAKRLGLAAEFERERAKGDKPSSTPSSSTASDRLRERSRSTESQVDSSDWSD